jgi:hypothetical protein
MEPEVQVLDSNNIDDDDEVQKSSPGKRTFSDVAAELVQDGTVVFTGPESENKRAKTASSLFSNAYLYDVHWSTYDYNVELLVKDSDETPVIMRCHTTQLAMFRYFRLMFKEEWTAKYERNREVDLSSTAWDVETWTAVLSCCYRRAALKPRDFPDNERYVLFTPSELEPKKLIDRDFKLRFDLLCFLNTVDKDGLWDASVQKKNDKYLKSFVTCFLLTSDVTNHHDLMLFKKLFSLASAGIDFADQAVDLAVAQHDNPICSQILRWAFLAVALTEEKQNWSPIFFNLQTLRTLNNKAFNKEIDLLLYQIAIFCPEIPVKDEVCRENIAGDRTCCLRVPFFNSSKDKQWFSRSEGPITFDFNMKPDIGNATVLVHFDDEDRDDMAGVLQLKKHFSIQHRDGRLYLNSSNYVLASKSFRLKWLKS